MTLLAAAFGARWVHLTMALLWGAFAAHIALDDYALVLDDRRWLAIQEGCIGPPHLFIAFAIAICAAMTYGALRPRHSGEN